MVLLVLLTLVAGLLTWATVTNGPVNSPQGVAEARQRRVRAPRDRARVLCASAFDGSVASTIPSTVGQLRDTMLRPVIPPATSTVIFRGSGNNEFGAWCWIREADAYIAYAVGPRGEKHAVETLTGLSVPPTAVPAPP